MTATLSPEMNAKVLAATRNTQLGAIIRCAMDIERDAVPRLVGKAHVTSDGYVMCDYYGANVGYKHGAFVGALSDLDLNIVGLSKHLGMTPTEYNALTALVTGWIGKDWRR